MEIRKLSEGDWERYKSFRLLSLRDSPQSFENGLEDELPLTNEEWVNRVTPSEDAFIVGAFIGSKLVGTAGFSRAQKAKIRHKSFLWGVFVQHGYRGKGIARKLVDFVLTESLGIEGVAQIQLTVGADNVGAMALYEKCGFQTYGVEADAIRVDEQSYDELLMSYAKKKQHDDTV